MTEKQTVTGTVAEVTPWKSGKGNWIGLLDNPNDFFAYANKSPKQGDSGTWEVKEGKEYLADKVELVKKVNGTANKAEVKEKLPEGIKTGKTVYLERAEADAIRQNSIERQSAIKSACSLVGELYPKQPKGNLISATDETLHVASRFLQFIKDEEPELPEPPEDK